MWGGRPLTAQVQAVDKPRPFPLGGGRKALSSHSSHGALGSEGQCLYLLAPRCWRKENLYWTQRSPGPLKGSLGRPQLRVSHGGCCGSPTPTYLCKQVCQDRGSGLADTRNLAAVWSLEEGPRLMHRCDWHRCNWHRCPRTCVHTHDEYLV